MFEVQSEFKLMRMKQEQYQAQMPSYQKLHSTPEELRVGFLRPSVPSGLDVQAEDVLTWVPKATWLIKVLGTAADAERCEPFVPTNTKCIKM